MDGRLEANESIEVGWSCDDIKMQEVRVFIIYEYMCVQTKEVIVYYVLQFMIVGGTLSKQTIDNLDVSLICVGFFVVVVVA